MTRFQLQHTEGGQGAEGGGKPADPPAAPAVDGAELTRLREAEKRLAALEAERVAEQKKARESAAAAAKDAEAKGDLARALEAQKARVAELEPLSAAAQKWAAYEAAELERIKEAKAKLPEAAQKALDAATTLEAKQAFLAALDTGASAKPAHKPTNSTGPGAPTAKVDFGSITDEATLRTAKAADPAGWEAHKASLRGGGQRQPTTFERRRDAKKARS